MTLSSNSINITNIAPVKNEEYIFMAHNNKYKSKKSKRICRNKSGKIIKCGRKKKK